MNKLLLSILVLSLVISMFGFISANDSYLKFNGINASLVFNNTNLPNIQQGNFSVSLWVKLNNLGHGVGNHELNEIWNLGNQTSMNDLSLIIRTQSSLHMNFSRFYVHNQTSGGQNNLDYCQGNTCSDIGSRSDAIWNNNQWYNIITTFNSTTMSMFIDGTLINNRSFNGIRGTKLSDFFGIGIGWDYLYYTNGSIDEVRVYNDSLSQNRVNEIYNSGRVNPNPSINSTNLVMWLPFNETSGSFVYDNSGNNLIGNLNNTEWFYDTTPPVITITSPQSKRYEQTSSITIDFSASDDTGINSLWWNDGITTYAYTVPVTIAINDRITHTYTFYANDSSNNVASTTVSFNFGCGTFEKTGYMIIALLTSLAVLLIGITFLVIRWNKGETTAIDFIILFVTLAIALGLYTAIINTIGGSCSVG